MTFGQLKLGIRAALLLIGGQIFLNFKLLLNVFFTVQFLSSLGLSRPAESVITMMSL